MGQVIIYQSEDVPQSYSFRAVDVNSSSVMRTSIHVPQIGRDLPARLLDRVKRDRPSAASSVYRQHQFTFRGGKGDWLVKDEDAPAYLADRKPATIHQQLDFNVGRVADGRACTNHVLFLY